MRRGKRGALAGPSGAGKSTVLRLLLRFYNPGIVSIDGVDLKTADLAHLRERTALVGQDAAPFSGSAYENPGCGRDDATAEAMRAAAAAAQATGFLDRPLGLRGHDLNVRPSGYEPELPGDDFDHDTLSSENRPIPLQLAERAHLHLDARFDVDLGVVIKRRVWRDANLHELSSQYSDCNVCY